MRINCPDCDAQYEVPDDVIPPEGRDVQCSNCGTTWFFAHPEHPGATQPDMETRDTDDDGEEPDDGPPTAPAPRRELDPRVADILRTEALRESAARAKEATPAPLEIQTELGLTEGPERPRRHVAEGEDNDLGDAWVAPAPERNAPGNMTMAAAMAQRGSRRDRLPDIEDINSTLQSDEEAERADAYPEQTGRSASGRKRGFGSGLVFALLVFVLGLLTYRFAPEIAEVLPQADPWLSSYVTWVEEMRVALDAHLLRLLEWLDAQAAALTD